MPGASQGVPKTGAGAWSLVLALIWPSFGRVPAVFPWRSFCFDLVALTFLWVLSFGLPCRLVAGAPQTGIRCLVTGAWLWLVGGFPLVAVIQLTLGVPFAFLWLLSFDLPLAFLLFPFGVCPTKPCL